MKFLMSFILLTLAFDVSGAEALPKDVVPECPAPPYSLTPIGPVFIDETRTNVIDETLRLRVWRLPCTSSDSILVVTVNPTNDPFYCSSSFTLVQNGIQYDGRTSITPQSSSVCGSVVTATTYYLTGRPVSGLPDFDPDAAFRLIFETSPSNIEGDIPAYDPTAYGGGAEPLIISGHLSGAWWNPTRAGEGVLVDVASAGGRTVVFIAWFTYIAGGQQWIAGNVDLQTGDRQATLPLIRGTGAQFGADFNPADVDFEPWGEATMSFDSCNSMTFEYTGPNGVTGTLTLQRLVGNLAGVPCP
jgi:hypothetical protein